MPFLDGFLSRRKAANRSDRQGGEVRRTAPRRLGIMALEPRMMYDAAAAATVAAARPNQSDIVAEHASIAAAERLPVTTTTNTGADSPGAGGAHTVAQKPNVETPPASPEDPTSKTTSSRDATSTSAPADSGTHRDVVFIDPQSGDLMGLYGGAKPGDLVFVLDPNKDGVQQIADILAAQDLHDLDAIHIVSHGLEAEVKLGTTVLTDGNLADHADALAAIGKALKPGGDLLLYGCDIAAGSDGQQFIHDIAHLTGAVVAASTNETGSSDLGGDWTLEAATGAITATNPFTDATLASYEGLLSIAWTVQGTATRDTTSGTVTVSGTDPFPALQFGSRIVTADFNNDGKLDIIYQTGAALDTGIHLALGNGNGTFQTPIDKPDGAAFTSGPLNGIDISSVANQATFYARDLNGDGKVDLILDPGGSTVPTVYLNTGSGFTAVTSPFPIQQFTGRFVFGDFNNDGFIDVLNQQGNGSGTNITLYVNKADGTIGFNTIAEPTGAAFTSGPLAGITFTQVLSANVSAVDLNGDGKVDIIDAQGGGGGTPLAPLVYQNTGSGFSAIASPFQAQSFGAHFVFGDFNSDGFIDVLNQSSDSNGATAGGTLVLGSGVVLYLNNGTGNIAFTAIAKPAGSAFTSGPLNGIDIPNVNYQNLLVGDWDKDGDPDLVDSENNASRYITQGTTGDPTGHPPHLASSTPADNSIGVSSNPVITLNFDEAVSKGTTGNISIVRTSDNTTVEIIPIGDARISGSGTAWTINPNTTLAVNTDYAVRIDARTFHNSDGAVFFGINDNTTLNFKTDAPPVLERTGSGTPTYTEQGTPAFPLAGSLHVAAKDTDNTTLAGATITLDSSFAGDLLSISSALLAGTGISIDPSSTATTLVLTGTANLASYEAAFENITFSSTSDNPTNYGANLTRTVNFTVTDGVATSNTVQTTLNVAAVNDKPVNHGVADLTVQEDTSSAITGLSVTDIDSNPAVDNIQVALAVQHGILTLQTNVASGITAGEIVGNGSSTVTVTATQNQIDATLAAVTGLSYLGALNFNGTDTLTITTDDQGHTGSPGALQAQSIATITVSPVNDAPDLTPNSPTALTYFATAPAVGLLATGAVSDIDNPSNFAGGGFTVAVTNAAAGDAIVLLGSSTFGTSVVGGTTFLVDGGHTIGTITGLGTSSVAVTALTSFATPTEVNSLVEAFGFTATGTAGDRSVKLTFNDGGNVGGGAGLTDSVTQTVHVSLANAAPTLTLNATTATAPEQTATALAPALTLTDVDGTTLLSAKMQITTGYHSGEDVLGFTDTAQIHGAFDASSGTLTLTAIAGQSPLDSDFQAALRSVTYTDSSDTPTTGARTVTFTVQDPNGTANGGHDTSTATATFSVTAVNDKPLLSQTSNTVSFTENGAAVQLLPTEVVSDPDLPANFSGGFVQVALTGGVAGDGIVLWPGSTFTVDGSGNVIDNGTTTVGTVTAGSFGTTAFTVSLGLNASASEVSALLKALSYVSNSDDPTAAARTATVTFDDGGNSGSGGSKTATATVTINVTPLNDAPTLSATGNNPTFTEGGTVATPFSGAVDSTIEAGQTITALQLTVTNVADGASEILNVDGSDIALVNGAPVTTATDGMTATVSVTGTTATVTLTKAAGISTAAAASLVDAITYRDTSHNPSTASRVVTLTSITDSGGTGNGGVDTTALSIASTVAVNAVNDAPSASAGGPYSATERTTLDLKNTLSVADLDGGSGVETVTLSVTEGTLDLVAGTSGAIVTNNDSAAVTVNGTVAQINDLLSTNATSTVSYIDNLHNPSASATLTLAINDNGHTGSGVTPPGTATAAINITPVNDAPVLDTTRVPALASIAEDLGPPPGVGSGLLVSSLVDLNPPAGGLDNVTDADNTVTGIALTAADSSHGTWSYSIDGGTTWNVIGTVSDASARLLAADANTRLYFQPNADFNGAVNPALTFRAWDETSGTNGGTASAAVNGGATAFSTASVSTVLVVTAVDDAPVLTVGGAPAASTEQVFGTLDGSATVSDKELDALNGGAGDYSGASLTIARHGAADAQDAFAFSTAGAAFTVSGNELLSSGSAFATFSDVGGVFTVSFTSAGTAATTALVNNVIDHISYANQSDTPLASVTLDTTFNDGNGNGAQGSGGALTTTAGKVVDITAVNDAPVNTMPGVQTTTQGADLVFGAAHGNAISVSDVDAGGSNITVTLSVVDGTLTVPTNIAGGLLAGGIAGNNSDLITLTGSQSAIDATLADANGLTYHPGLNFAGTDTLTVTTDDGGHTGTGLDGVATSAVAIVVTPTNGAALVLSLTGSGAFAEGPAAASVVTSATVTDSSTNLQGATVTISGGFLAGDTLSTTTTMPGITESYANGVLTLSGSDTLADYNAVLSSVQFSTASHNPTLYGTDPTRTLTWIVNDGTLSGSATSTVAVTGVDDAPVNQVPGAQAALEDKSLAVTGVSISDVDANPASDSITVTLSVGHGKLTVATNLLGAGVANNDSGTVTLTGTQNDIDATLAEANGLVYLGAPNFNGGDTLTIVTDDGGHTPAPARQTTDHVDITVVSVNDAPSGTDSTITVNVGGARALTTTDFGFGDTNDNPAANALKAVEITTLPTKGSLTDNGTAVFAGQFVSLADINGGNLVFTPGAGASASPYTTFTFQVQDKGGTANGGVDIDPAAKTMTIDTVVSQPPVLANVTATDAFTEGGGPLPLSSGLGVSDLDSPNLSGATVTISAGTLFAGDELSVGGATTGTSGHITWNFSGGKLTFSGLDTPANYQALLDQVAYRSTSQDPTNGGVDAARDISWVATDDSGVPSLAATTQVDITAINNAPVASITPTYGSVDERASLSLKGAGLSVSDVDGNNHSETVTLTVNEGILNVTAGTSGASVQNSGTALVTITGAVAQIEALLNSDPTSTVAFVDTSHTPLASVGLTLTIDDNGATGGGDQSVIATAAITVNPVNDAPVASIAQPTYNAVEQTSLDLHNTGISVSDVDSQGRKETVTLSVGEGTLAVDAGSSGAIVSGSGASITISGTIVQINDVLGGGADSKLSYVDNTDTPSASTTLTLTIDDGGNTGAPGAKTGSANAQIIIAPVDDAPSVVDSSIKTNEDAGKTFTAADFTFSDIDNNALKAVVIESLPTNGTLTLSGSTITAGTSVAAAQIANLVYTPNADFNGADQFTFKVQDDGNANGLGQDISANTGTMAITINSVNDAPAATTSSVTTTEDAAKTFAAADFQFSDAHDSPPNSLQAVIIDTLPTNGTLTLDGIAVTAHESILATDVAKLVYNPNADFNGTDGFTFDVQDNGGVALGGHDTSTNAALMSINVTSVNDAPSAVSSARTINEDTPTNFAASDFNFTDAHDNPPNGLQAVIINSLPTNGTLSLHGVAVAAHDAILATDLANLVYAPGLNFNGTDTFTFDVQDNGGTSLGGGHDTSTNSAVMTITINPVNDAPVLSGVQSSAAFTPGGSAVQLSKALAVDDVDNTTLFGATVRVSAGTFVGDGDALSVNGITSGTIGGITFSYNAGSETLSLTGTDTKANYQQVLEQVDFRSTSFSPTNGGLNTSRTITWQLDDGSGAGNNNLSTPVTSEVFLHTLDLDGNDSTAPGTSFATTYTEHGTPVPVADIDTVISDSDATTMKSATITLNHAQATDLLSINGTLPGGISASSYVFNSGTGVLTLTGLASTAAYQSALHQVVFSSSSGNIDVTDRDVAISVTDNNGAGIVTNTAHATISIVAVNDPPTVDAHGGSLGYTENDKPTAIDPLLTLTDPDSANINSATVKITGNFQAGEDVLDVAGQNGISGKYDPTTGVLTLTGPSSVANYEAALRSVTYFDSSDNPSALTRTISFQAVDDGGAPSSVSTATVAVTPVNDAPVVAGLGASAGFTENGNPVALSSGAVVTDVDSTLLTGASVAITNGFVAGDTLNVDTTGTAVTASYNGATGVLTLTGQDTLGDYQHVLASVTFTTPSDNPTSFGTEPTRTVTWSLTDLDQTSPAHVNATGTAVTSVAVIAINDAPVVTAGNTLNFDANTGQRSAIDAGILLHDVDSLTLASAKVAITGGFDAAHDSLAFVNQHGISGSYDSATGVLTLTGAASVADYQAALASVTFFSTTQRNGTRSIEWTVDDGSAQFHQSLTDTTTLNVKGIITSPHVFTDNNAPATSTPNVTPASLVVDGSRSFQLPPATGGDFGTGTGGGGSGFFVVHTDAVLTTASDATVQINLALAALEAPLGGDVVFVTARQANGDPLPDWLKFDPATGTFAGLPPDGIVASIEPEHSSDNNIVTGSVSPYLDLGFAGLDTPVKPNTITIEVTARDSKGNIAVSVFTIELRPQKIGRQGWNAQPFGNEHHASLPMLSPELAAIEAAVRDVTRPLEPFGMRGMPNGRGEHIAAETAPAGRAGLTEQLASIGWRSMAAQRNALLASLQQR